MYAQIDQFAIDKSRNVIVEEGIAPHFIRAYWAAQGKRVQVHYNLQNGLTGRREYDLSDTYGTKWEVKDDRRAHVTGNVYLEKPALERSKADKYLIFACGMAYVVEKRALDGELAPGAVLTPGGDDNRSLGLKLSLQRLEEISEQLITL